MQEQLTDNQEKKSFLSFRSAVILTLLLVIAGSVLAVISIFNGIIDTEELQSRKNIEKKAESIFLNSEEILRSYVEKRNEQRDRIAAGLQKDVINTTADIQIFLQSLFIKYEADINKSNLAEVMKKREMLATFALQRFNTMTKEMLRLKEEVERMQDGIDEVLAQAKAEEAEPILNGSVISGGYPAENPVKNDALNLEMLKKINILADAVVASKEYQKNGMTKQEILKIRELRRYLEDKKLITSTDPAQILQESSPDIVNILPEKSVLTITEVGGKVVLSLGADMINAEAVTAQTSRSLLFQLLNDSYHWVINLLLTDSSVPLPPNIAEAAELIADNIAASTDHDGISGYFFAASGLIHTFPENAGMKSNVPEKGWKDIKSAGIATYYTEHVFSFADNKEFSLGLCFELPQLTLKERINRFIEASPYYVILLLVTVLIMLGSFFAIGYLGLKGGKQQKIITVSTGVDINIRNIKPKLGSLKRLQAINRGHSVGGSRILDYTRNDALKELVKRVRKDSALNEHQAGGSELVSEPVQNNASRSTASKPLHAHKAGLREYLK